MNKQKSEKERQEKKKKEILVTSSGTMVYHTPYSGHFAEFKEKKKRLDIVSSNSIPNRPSNHIKLITLFPCFHN